MVVVCVRLRGAAGINFLVPVMDVPCHPSIHPSTWPLDCHLMLGERLGNLVLKNTSLVFPARITPPQAGSFTASHSTA
jgi:hypothetical protein